MSCVFKVEGLFIQLISDTLILSRFVMYFPSHISVSSSGASFVIFLCGGVQPEKCRILQAKHNYFRARQS